MHVGDIQIVILDLTLVGTAHTALTRCRDLVGSIGPSLLTNPGLCRFLGDSRKSGPESVARSRSGSRRTVAIRCYRASNGPPFGCLGPFRAAFTKNAPEPNPAKHGRHYAGKDRVARRAALPRSGTGRNAKRGTPDGGQPASTGGASLRSAPLKLCPVWRPGSYGRVRISRLWPAGRGLFTGVRGRDVPRSSHPGSRITPVRTGSNRPNRPHQTGAAATGVCPMY